MTRYGMEALGQLCDVSIGRTPRRSESRFGGGPHPWATIRDLDGGTLMATGEGITDAALDEVMPRPVEPGTLLFSFKLSIGRMGFAGRAMHHNEAIAALPVRDPNVLDREFLFYALRATTHEGAANHAVLGKVLNKRKVEQIKIPVPPLDEQRRIVAMLNRAAKIERLRVRVAERLREFVPALFVRMFGDPVENPMGWRTARVGDVCEVQGGLQVSKRRAANPLESPYLRVANVLRNELFLDEIKRIRLTEREQRRVRLQKGDLLIVEGHGNADEIGRVAVWDGSIADCVHQNHLIRARPDESSVLPSFACAYLNSSSGRQHLLRRGKTTSGLNTITTSDVKSCAIFVPSIELQKKFEDAEDKARQLSLRSETAAEGAATLSSSAMAKLLSSSDVVE